MVGLLPTRLLVYRLFYELQESLGHKMNGCVLLSLQRVSMGMRANPRKVILPKLSLAGINSTLDYKTFRWAREPTQETSYYLK